MVRIILFRKHGQLANRLFAFAPFIAFANHFPVKIWYPALEEYAFHFEQFHKSLIPIYPSYSSTFLIDQIAKKLRFFLYELIYSAHRILKKMGLENFGFIMTISRADSMNRILLDENFYNNIANRKFVFIEDWGFKVTEINFNNHLSIIQNTRFLDGYYKNVEQFKSTICKSKKPLIGVHARLGDYKNFEGGKFYYAISEYIGWMHQLQRMFQTNVAFVICSNERRDSEWSTKGVGLDIHFALDHLIKDLITLSKCDYIIGPPSTYSMWASMIGGTPLQMIRSKDHDLKIEKFKIYRINEVQP